MLLIPSHKCLTHRPISANANTSANTSANDNNCTEYLCIEYVLTMMCMPSEFMKRGNVYKCVKPARKKHQQEEPIDNEIVKSMKIITYYELQQSMNKFYHRKYMLKKKNELAE